MFVLSEAEHTLATDRCMLGTIKRDSQLGWVWRDLWVTPPHVPHVEGEVAPLLRGVGPAEPGPQPTVAHV